MKKARIILATVALLALVGGAFAFKAARFNGLKVYTSTQLYSTNATLYTATTGGFFVGTELGTFRTTAGGGASTVFTTIGTTAPGSITLYEVGHEANTITIPAWRVTTLATLTTAID